MITLYGIKNCDSVKKAIAFFKKNNITYTLHDFKTDPVGCSTIEQWLQKVDINTLFNNRSTTYRTHKLKEMQLDDTGKKEWLCKENLLIKRPVIVTDETIIVGFKEENYTKVFL